MDNEPRMNAALIRVGCFAVAVLTILGYRAVGLAFYRGFRIPQGYGVNVLLPEELVHSMLFLVFGLAAMALLVVALEGLTFGERDLARLRRLAEPGHLTVIALGLFVFVASGAIAGAVLEHAVITDDEHAYHFIAETLRTGSLTAASPGRDLEFFREQFVVLTDRVRYGKYPIGHPLLLAAGQALGAEHLVVPLVTALIVVPLFWVGSMVFGGGAATLGVALFALSPQVLLTGATLLSQPASALCLVAGLASLLAAERSPRRDVWLAAAGASFGYGVLVRPLPGALFALVATAYVALRHRPAPARHRVLRAWIAFGLPLLVFAGLMALINREQAGGALVTGYEAFHRPGEGVGSLFGVYSLAQQAMSLASHLVRLNFWLLGWPLSLAFCVFARRVAPRVALLWAMIAAAWAYRLLSPKVGVAGTGPQYLFEVVPLLCLLTADGILQLAGPARLAGGARLSPKRAVAIVLAGTFVSASMFLPVKLAGLGQMADAQLILPRMIRETGLTRALVFHDLAVPPPLGLSWAYSPRFNSPRLDGDILFVRLQRRQGEGSGLQGNLDFWKRRFPDRAAWYFGYFSEEPRLVPLESYVRQMTRSGPAGPDREPAATPTTVAAGPGAPR